MDLTGNFVMFFKVLVLELKTVVGYVRWDDMFGYYGYV